jgi:cell wall-associated NlpC family hydrolase
MSTVFAVTKTFTPVLDTPHWNSVFGGENGSSLPLNDQGLLKCVETVLFPKSRVEILDKNQGIARIRTKEYPYGEKLFVDERFLDFNDKNPPERQPTMPSRTHILNFLDGLAANQTKYIWGGNRSAGIPEMLDYYAPKTPLSPEMLAKWTFTGCDCSGMIYEATQGITPRNTSRLVTHGVGIPVQGLSIDDIISVLQPLDMIVWNGHALYIYDQSTTIESSGNHGVIRTGLEERLEEIKADGSVPVDDWQSAADKGNRFVVRRWHPESNMPGC